MPEINKEKSCYMCPDRVLGCHTTCEYYIKRKKMRAEINQKRQQDRTYYEYKAASADKRLRKYHK